MRGFLGTGLDDYPRNDLKNNKTEGYSLDL